MLGLTFEVMSPVPQPIHEAIKGRNITDALKMLEVDRSLCNSKDDANNTPLFYAVTGFNELGERGPVLVKALIDNGADCNVTGFQMNISNDAISLLQISVATAVENDTDSLQLVKLLLDGGANHMVRLGEYEKFFDVTPLHMALVRCKHNFCFAVNLVKILLEHGADPNCLCTVVDTDTTIKLNAVNLALPFNFNDGDSEISLCECQTLVEILLQYGATLNVEAEEQSADQIVIPPLHTALFCLSDDETTGIDEFLLHVIGLFLQHGADPNQPLQMPDSITAAPIMLLIGMWRGTGNLVCFKLTEMLLQHGANPNLVHSSERFEDSDSESDANAKGTSILQQAILGCRTDAAGSLSLCKLLLEHRADPNTIFTVAEESVALNSLQLAIRLWGEVEDRMIWQDLVSLLLCHGADTNQPVHDSTGLTLAPIHYAIGIVLASQNCLDKTSGLALVEALLKNGANPNMPMIDGDGKEVSTLQMALRAKSITNGSAESVGLIKVLLNSGVNPSIDTFMASIEDTRVLLNILKLDESDDHSEMILMLETAVLIQNEKFSEEVPIPDTTELTETHRRLKMSVSVEAGTMQCKMLVKKSGIDYLFPEFEFFTEDEKFLMSAKRNPGQKENVYIISSEKGNYDLTSRAVLGVLVANKAGTEFQILEQFCDQEARELGVVLYPPQCTTAEGLTAKKVQVYLPLMSETGNFQEWRPINGTYSMLGMAKQDDRSHLSYFVNKLPSIRNGQLTLNFNGRAILASSKNFQLIQDGCDDIVLQFGRVARNTFALDFAHPFSPFQAFAVGLSIFGIKIKVQQQRD